MASAFIDDNERNLLFRVYVPAGRLYAAEADKLLNLFRDWLNQVGREGIRQDGYSTAAGHVYELFGSSPVSGQVLTKQFDGFASFLNKCVDDPGAAEDALLQLGVDRLRAPGMVQRYGKEARRIQIDLRQEREVRVLALRHRLESELLDADDASASMQDVAAIIERLVPRPPALRPQGFLLTGSPATAGAPVTVNINQQFVQAAEGAIVHNVQGTAHYGPEAKELLALIERFAGSEAQNLETAVHELEDSDARSTDRLGAKQRIKAFLFRIGDEVKGPAIEILQRYIEAKMGL